MPENLQTINKYLKTCISKKFKLEIISQNTQLGIKYELRSQKTYSKKGIPLIGLRDDREELEGTFYQPELQKTTEDTFRIEKVLRWKRKDDGTRIARVKWVGYDTSYNSWVPETEITKYGNN